MSKMLLQKNTLCHKKCPKSFLGTLRNVKLVIFCFYLIFEKNGHYAFLPHGMLAEFNIQDIIDDLFVDCEDLIAYLHDTNSSQYDDTNTTILNENEWFRSMQNVTKGELNNTFAFVDNATYSYTTESNLNHTVDPKYNFTFPYSENITNDAKVIDNYTVQSNQSYQCFGHNGYDCVYIYTIEHNPETTAVTFTNITEECIPLRTLHVMQNGNISAGLYYIFIIIGLIGNVSMITTLIKSSATFSSTVIYFIALAVFDNISLLNFALMEALRISTSIDITTLSSTNCKLFSLLHPASFEISNLILGTITLERAMSVAMPLRVSYIFNPRSAKLIISVICLLIGLVNCNAVIEYSVKEVHGDFQYCSSKLINMSTFGRWYIENQILLRLLLQFVIPFCLVVTGNGVIIIALFIRHRKRKKLKSTQSHFDKAIVFTLVRISVFFIITTLPYLVIAFYEIPDVEERMITADITSLLQCLNCVMNFYLYFLGGSRFRAMFAALFCKRCLKTRQARTIK